MYVRADSASRLVKRMPVACRGTKRTTIVKRNKKANCVVPKANALPSRKGGQVDILRMDVERTSLEMT